MQTKNSFADAAARFVAEVAGAADGVRREAETVMHSQLQRFLADQNLVPREEFEAVKEMAVRALDEVERLRAEVDALRGAEPHGS
jgi:BMFP domain-containing protein YqiC